MAIALLLPVLLVGSVAALPRASPVCDFSQVPTNPLYASASQRPAFGPEYCDNNHGGNFAGFYPCGGEQPNGEVFPPCNVTFDEMESCGETYAAHSDCKFGDSFVGKIGCKYANAGHSVLLPDAQQPITCKQDYTWCCPCGYDNGGLAERTCGGAASYQEAWSAGFSLENLLPAGDAGDLSLEQVQSWGWYSTSQLYMYCNVKGKCVDLVKPDDPYSTPGGCSSQLTDPTPCKQKGPAPTTPKPTAAPTPTPAPPAPSCAWETASVKCSSDTDCAAWVTANCPAGLAQKYCKGNGFCHLSP
eukprot:TRINITY_DN18181_c0_g1_i1.p1 TRINITY_DN18181_c0_g1~~TRINITY_DN18181_c0_g1_i1.p1  ORF type:complete len:301 (+),score=56.49 TRINITY_DN18181_c0_g1_i1:142-1044(+)